MKGDSYYRKFNFKSYLMSIPVQGGDAVSGRTHFNKTGSKIPAGQV
jgi:hypothetical protein